MTTGNGAIGAIGAIGVIGTGRLGTALAAAIAGTGAAVTVASRRSPPAALLAVKGISTATRDEVVARCDLVFLTVPDREIAAVAGSVPWRAGQGIAHCSGALGLDALAAATPRGVTPACLHPLQTFPAGTPPANAAALFRGITCGVEGAEPLGARLEALVRALGARPVRLEGVDRARYHAAAVFASNNVVALMAAAMRTWALAGLPEETAREALAPLLIAAARNIGALPLARALTGPVARGDVATVERHLAALAGEPAIAGLYRRLGAELLRLDLGHTAEVTATLHALLDDG